MQPRSWDDVEREQLSATIVRQAIHGVKATIARFELAKDATVVRHVHANEQITFVMEGALELQFDDRSVVLRPGRMLVIPPDVPHAARALEDSVVMDFFSPRREDWVRKEDAYLRR